MRGTARGESGRNGRKTVGHVYVGVRAQEQAEDSFAYQPLRVTEGKYSSVFSIPPPFDSSASGTWAALFSRLTSH